MLAQLAEIKSRAPEHGYLDGDISFYLPTIISCFCNGIFKVVLSTMVASMLLGLEISDAHVDSVVTRR